VTLPSGAGMKCQTLRPNPWPKAADEPKLEPLLWGGPPAALAEDATVDNPAVTGGSSAFAAGGGVSAE